MQRKNYIANALGAGVGGVRGDVKLPRLAGRRRGGIARGLTKPAMLAGRRSQLQKRLLTTSDDK